MERMPKPQLLQKIRPRVQRARRRGSALILANGRPPAKPLLMRLHGQAQIMVCADGGANAAARAGLRPDLIIGDLDSVAAETLRAFRSVPLRRIAEQNSTDLEKAIQWLLRKGFSEIIIAGATGGRLDHVAGNLHVIGKFANRAHLRVVEKEGELRPVRKVGTFAYAVGSTLSLIPVSRCSGITTKGLRWELRNATLELGIRDGTSNRVVTTPVEIRVRKGTLLVYHVSPKGSQGR